jgi:hypothetical protein
MYKGYQDLDHLPEHLLTYVVVKMLLLSGMVLLLWLYFNSWEQPFSYPYLFALD